LNSIAPGYKWYEETNSSWREKWIVLEGVPNEQGVRLAARCDYDANDQIKRDPKTGGKMCYSYVEVFRGVTGSGNVSNRLLDLEQRVLRAINYIYSNFCSYAEYKKPF
jgi:hypothetical protein